jgi:hypothetical protein
MYCCICGILEHLFLEYLWCFEWLRPYSTTYTFKWCYQSGKHSGHVPLCPHSLHLLKYSFCTNTVILIIRSTGTYEHYLFVCMTASSFFTCPHFPHSYIFNFFTHIITADLHGSNYNTKILKLRKWWKEWIRPASSNLVPWQSRKSEILTVQDPEINAWIEVNIVSHFSLKNSGHVDDNHLWGLCSSGILHSMCWYFDVSEQPSNPIFKGQLTPEVGLIGCPEMSVNTYQHMLHNIPEGLWPQLVIEPWKFLNEIYFLPLWCKFLCMCCFIFSFNRSMKI